MIPTNRRIELPTRQLRVEPVSWARMNRKFYFYYKASGEDYTHLTRLSFLTGGETTARGKDMLIDGIDGYLSANLVGAGFKPAPYSPVVGCHCE